MAEIIPKGMWFEDLPVGLVVKHPLTRTITESDNVQFTVATMNPAPLFHGDTVHVESEVVAARASNSNPDRGIVTFEHRGYNQHDVLVCSAVRNAMMHKRPAA